jgi:hypothetical protein
VRRKLSWRNSFHEQERSLAKLAGIVGMFEYEGGRRPHDSLTRRNLTD